MTVELGSPGASAGSEWPGTLDLSALRASGWRPTPFREFILKVHSRCDLACDYCYMYEMADQSWRHRPLAMPGNILECAAARIGEHAISHDLDSIELILHGGEPLLAGSELLEAAVTAVREAASGVRVRACIQTNAVRLDTSFLNLFDRLDVHVGVSLDGDISAHDRHRRRSNGTGSHAAVETAMKLLTSSRYRHLFNGVLCTIDLRNDPQATYDALMAWRPPVIDFLLPHGTWAAPPPGRNADDPATPYADWLIPLFDRWYRSSPGTEVRFFGELVRLQLGGSSTCEALGLTPVGMLVIETDGSIEQADALKSVHEGAAATGLHVERDPLDAAFWTPGVVARQIGAAALSPECLACRVHTVCGAGMYPHRYRPGRGFANPSVYCPDLFRLITHVNGVVRSDLTDLRRKH